VLFPLARYTKPEVRALAHKWGLPTAQREESMGICFVGEKRRFDDFLAQYLPPRPGSIVDLSTGKVLGMHRGLWSYTIGQNARIGGMAEKMFVAKKNVEKNEIYVVPGHNHPALFRKGIIVSKWQWVWGDSIPSGINHESGFRGRVKFRYRMEDIPCTVRSTGPENSVHITFDEPQKDVAPGQVAAVYDADWCLGCGSISEVY